MALCSSPQNVDRPTICFYIETAERSVEYGTVFSLKLRGLTESTDVFTETMCNALKNLSTFLLDCN
jgi:hypothetical protein